VLREKDSKGEKSWKECERGCGTTAPGKTKRSTNPTGQEITEPAPGNEKKVGSFPI